MKKVIAAVDNSAASRPVLAVALALAPVLAATVETVQIVEEEGITARGAAEAADVPLRLIPGDPVEWLSKLANEEETVALVIGVRGRPEGREPVGHVPLQLCWRTDKPVVLLSPDASAPERLEKVVVAMETQPNRVRRLQRDVELASVGDLEIVVVHVDDEITIPSFSDEVQYEMEDYAEEFLARNLPGSPGARFEPRVGIPADEILAAAESLGAQLIVIGRPQTDAPGRGWVAREILARSPIPVLLVATAE